MLLAADLDRLSAPDLKALALTLLGEVAELQQVVAEQRAEIARLKGLKGPPSIKPSGMEQATKPRPSASGSRRRGRGAKRVGAAIEDRVLAAEGPAGARFKGYETYLIQDLIVRPIAVRFRRERWLTPDGRTIVAPLPAGIDGPFGPELRRFVLAQYYHGQVTVPRLVALLDAIGIAVSKRQVVRLLIDSQGRFRAEAQDVLRAGLANAAWVTVDDTGARHKAQNGTCTHIGNDRFAWFGTTGSKSRLNFLDLLRAGHSDYVINPEALAYMRSRSLAGPVIRPLAEHEAKHFRRSGGLAGPSRPARHLSTQGHAGSHADRNRRRAVGQRQDAWPDQGHCDRQRRCRTVPSWPPCSVLGPCRAAGPQARYLHRPPSRRPAADAQLDLVVLRRSEGLPPRSDAGTKGRLARQI